ncbi:MAG: hypothetical protein ACOH1J_03350 [Microbacteriaceae bacterium]
MKYRHTAYLVAGMSVALTAILLTGCASETTPTPRIPTETPATVATPSAEPTVAAAVFSMPQTCADILPSSRITQIEAQGLVLLGGPGGRYGTDYLLEASPEERVGGITCIWGFSDSEVSSITVSVAPLNAQARASVVDSFLSEGLNETEANGANVFSQQGDTRTEPAIINALRADSWISVIATLGGTEVYEESLKVLDEATATAYVAG